jgi:hypothetical protein
MLSYAVIYAMAVLGEAAAEVSPATRKACPELPWAVNGRDAEPTNPRLPRVNLQVGWKTLCEDLPPLLEALDGDAGRALKVRAQDDSVGLKTHLLREGHGYPPPSTPSIASARS